MGDCCLLLALNQCLQGLTKLSVHTSYSFVCSSHIILNSVVLHLLDNMITDRSVDLMSKSVFSTFTRFS